MGGPAKKLPQLERLDGNPTKKPILSEFLPAIGEAFIPDHLPDDAQRCMEVVKASMPDKVYSQADTYTIAAFAMAWAMHKEAAHHLSDPRSEAVIQGPDGEIAISLWVKVLNDQAKIIGQLGDRLGLNPKARVGIQIPDRRQAPSSFETLLGRRMSSGSLST